MRRLLITLLLLFAPSVANAQLAQLPGLSGIPRGVTGCQYIASGQTLLNGQGSLLQCTVNGDLLTANTIGGSAISATNGSYTNLLQGNAVNASGNPIFAQITAGTAAIGTVNPTTAANWAIGATASTLPANARLGGCAGLSTQQTAVTTGQLAGCVADLDGKLTNVPYAPRAMMSRSGGQSSVTGTTITLLAASGTASVYEYLTSMQCSNTSATTITVLLNDTAGSVFIVPAGGGTNVTFPVPLRSNSANSALTATLSANAATIYCNGQGYNSL
jgi:hypothetical protein